MVTPLILMWLNSLCKQVCQCVSDILPWYWQEFPHYSFVVVYYLSKFAHKNHHVITWLRQAQPTEWVEPIETNILHV